MVYRSVTFLINLTEKCTILPEIFWIKVKPDLIIMKLGVVPSTPIIGK